MKPSFVQISMEAHEIRLAPLAPSTSKVTEFVKGVPPGLAAGTSGAEAVNVPATRRLAAMNAVIGARSPFSAIWTIRSGARRPTS